MAFQVGHKNQVRTEILAGITSFFAISYIIIVNPMILKDAGIPANLSVFATIFSSAIGCFIMGLWAKAPIVLTPGMGVNAFFTYTLVVGMHLTWQQAVAISFFSSFIYVGIAFTSLSERLSALIPASLKAGITVGIGLFLVVLGLEKAELIRSGGTQSLLALGDLSQATPLLALLGLTVTLVLYLRQTPGSFIVGIFLISGLAGIFKLVPQATTQITISQIRDYPQLLMQGDFSSLWTLKFGLAVFSMTMILVFESMGLLEGLLTDQQQFKRAFQASAVTTLLSGFLGTSPTVAAAESASGIESGGRTGITAFTAGTLFLGALFFIPLLRFVPQAAIAPVIIITGALMMMQVQAIDLQDFTEWFPAFLMIVLIPLTGSISTGLAFGFVFYPIVKWASHKTRQLNWTLVGLAMLFLLELICNTFLM